MWRRISQFAAALALNPFLANLVRGRIYQGALKSVCVPGLNCYSCPAALGACPVGSLQVTLSSVRGWLSGAVAGAAAAASLYVAGVILLVGAVGGRLACGWICPFGLLQELLFTRRRAMRGVRLPAGARYVKYAMLVVLVVGAPLVMPYPSSPNFCKFVCPAGLIEAGAPLVGYDIFAGRGAFVLGWLFAWKAGLAVVILAGILFTSRFFCRAICPLGAAWGLFNRISLVAIDVDRSKCTRCGFCRTVCPVDILIYEDAGSAECVRCFKCTRCPESAVKVVLRGRRRNTMASEALAGDGNIEVNQAE